VVAMVIWHTADGWLDAATRTGQTWAVLRFLGGLPAPSFLFLAGAALGLVARPGRSSESPLLTTLARALEIMLFGYALRFQTWLIDASAITHLYLARSWLPLGVGYALLWSSLRSLDDRRQATRLASAGALLALVGLAQVPFLAPGRLPRLLQVDVLQAIGASLALLTLAERRFALLQRPRLALAIGALVAIATAPVASVLPGFLPVPLAAYLGKFDPAAGAPQPSLFPLLPWFAYAAIGASFGTALRKSGANDERFIVTSGWLGALLGLCTSEAHPFVQHLFALAPWTMHPMRVAFRVSLVLTLLLIGWVWASSGRGWLLVSYGRASLRVYWAHLLIAYGSLGHPWQKQLTLAGWGVRVLPLLLLMWLTTRIGGTGLVPRKVEAST